MLFDPRATKYLMYGTFLIWALAFLVIGLRSAHDKMAGAEGTPEHQDKRATIVAHEDEEEEEAEKRESFGKEEEVETDDDDADDEDEDEKNDEDDEDDEDDHSVEGRQGSRSQPGKSRQDSAPARREHKKGRRSVSQ
jgi:hypothetical protein